MKIAASILLLSLATVAFNPTLAQQQTLDLDTFTGVKLGLPANLYIKQGSPQKVVIEASNEVMEHINAEINDNILYLVKHDNDSRWWSKWRGEKVRIYITAPNIGHIAASGSGNIESENMLRTESLYVRVSGSGNIKVEVEADDLEGKVSGSGNMDLKGIARNTIFSVSGSGNLDAENLAADNCQVKISGSGNCRVQVKDNLVSKISGSGKVYYSGDPEKIINNSSGSGSLNKAG